MEEFLKRCEKSGDSAYNALKSLLEKLDDPTTRADARVFLSDLQKRFDSKDSSDLCFDNYHFRIHDVLLSDYEGLNLSFSLCQCMMIAFAISFSCSVSIGLLLLKFSDLSFFLIRSVLRFL